MHSPLKLAAVAAILAIPLVAWVFFSPRRLYRQRATTEYEAARSSWRSAQIQAYRMTVSSNSKLKPPWGRNIVVVKNGEVVEASNPECATCELDDYKGLTVGELFRQIEQNCLNDFPRRYCSVSYDRDLGYPRILNMYPTPRESQEWSSVTIETLEIVR